MENKRVFEKTGNDSVGGPMGEGTQGTVLGVILLAFHLPVISLALLTVACMLAKAVARIDKRRRRHGPKKEPDGV